MHWWSSKMKTNSRISDLISSLRFGGLSLEHLRPYDTKLVLVFDYTLRITRILKCKDAFSTSLIHLAEFDLKSSLWNCRDDAWKSSIFRPLDSACKGQNSILNPHYIQCHRGVISERWLAEYWEAGFIIFLAALKNAIQCYFVFKFWLNFDISEKSYEATYTIHSRSEARNTFPMEWMLWESCFPKVDLSPKTDGMTSWDELRSKLNFGNQHTDIILDR
jgi:hypothetical protein